MLASTASAFEVPIPVTATIAENGQTPVSGTPYFLYPSWPTYVVHEGQPFQINVQQTGVPLLTDRACNASFWDATGSVVLGYMPKVAADSSGKATIQVPSLSFLTPSTTPYRVFITYFGWESPTMPWSYVVDVYLYVIPTTSTSVPEFPTIAVPIVAILGLMFVFGGQKKSIE